MDLKKKQIRELALFRDLDAGEIDWIARNADALDMKAGRSLATRGRKVSEFCIVVDGVCSSSDERDAVVLSRGAYFGGFGTSEVYGRDITTLTPVRLLVFERRIFNSLLARRPELAARIARVVSEEPAVPQLDEVTSRNLRAVS